MLVFQRLTLPKVKIYRNLVKNCSSLASAKSDENQSLKKSIMNMDTPPVLFISKYNKIVETSTQTDSKIEEIPADLMNWSPQSFDRNKVNTIIGAVKDTNTFEDLLERLNLKNNASPSKESEPSNSNQNAVKNESTNLSIDFEDAVSDFSSTKLDKKKLPSYYMMLSKFRLSMLVATSSIGGFCLAPIPLDFYGLILSTVGVSLLSASANSINQFLEVPFDSQMNRTRNRVLVRGLLTSKHVLGFAAVTGLSGTIVLLNFSNTLAASLGVLNLILYTCIYTPLKRVSIINTWIGSIVGAIPPLIGWSAATGSLSPSAFVLASILYAWQFPHFNSLSWNLRPDYSKAGYRMTAVTDPDLCKRVALRYSVGCIGICSVIAPALDLTTYAFALDTIPLNGYLTFLAWKFYKNGDSSTSRTLFRFTLVHLPTLMLLMFISKK